MAASWPLTQTPHLYDGHLFGAESFYEELRKDTTWDAEMEKALEQRLGYSKGSLDTPWDSETETSPEQRLTEQGAKSEKGGKWDIEGMPRLGQ